MKNKNQICKKRHSFWFAVHRPVIRFMALLKHYKVKSTYKMKKGESIVVLSNHQTDMDGLFSMLHFNKPIHGVTTDSFKSKGLIAVIWTYMFGLIFKKKGAVDLKANMDMVRCMREGGSLLLFPEGNRTYAEFQFSFTDGFAKFIRFFKKTIVLLNIHGGCGVYPRFAKSRRKGPYYGEIKKVLHYEDYEKLSDEGLYNLIAENLKVYDSESGDLYKSDERGEYLERMFFVCPKCGKVQTLRSEGNYLHCENCGLKVEFTEDLKLRSDDKDFKFNKLIDWYNYQIRFVRDYKVSDDPIFVNDKAKLFIEKVGKKRELLVDGNVSLDKEFITFGEKKIPLKEIEIASPISGTNFNFSANGVDYLVMGSERFNPLKYVLMFNKLDTKMMQDKIDIYYNLVERK